MSFAINLFGSDLTPRITWRICLFLMFAGTVGIWYEFGRPYSKDYTIWIPEHPRYLNKVNGVLVKASDFTATLPTITINLDDFQNISRGNIVDVAISGADITELKIHYTLIQNGTQYVTQTHILNLSVDSYDWNGTDTVTVKGSLILIPLISNFLWILWSWAFCYLPIKGGQDAPLKKLYDFIGRRKQTRN